MEDDHQTSTSSKTSLASPVSCTSVTINNLENVFNDIDLHNMDSIKFKHDNDFRLILQNPNGIAVYKHGDPEYLPSMESFKNVQAEVICLSETNVPWHNHDLQYSVTKQNPIIWNSTPTKTIAASCRTEQKTYKNYQPGGVLSVTTANMTTKIKSFSSDKMGR